MTTSTATADNSDRADDTVNPVIAASDPYEQLCTATARLKSLADRLTDDERFCIFEELTATMNALVNTRR